MRFLTSLVCNQKLFVEISITINDVFPFFSLFLNPLGITEVVLLLTKNVCHLETVSVLGATNGQFH